MMLVSHLFIIGFIAATTSATTLVVKDNFFTILLKRQEPGTPQYDCHVACGTAINLSRGADPCNNSSFVTKYDDCLACAGPSGANIWRYYGGTLSTVGSRCGFATEPSSGGSVTTASSSATAPISSPSRTSAVVSASSAAASMSATPTGSAVVSATALSSSVSRAPSSSANVSTSAITSSPSQQPVNAAAGPNVARSVAFGVVVIVAMFGL